jgi:hypothetical protein
MEYFDLGFLLILMKMHFQFFRQHLKKTILLVNFLLVGSKVQAWNSIKCE